MSDNKYLTEVKTKLKEMETEKKQFEDRISKMEIEQKLMDKDISKMKLKTNASYRGISNDKSGLGVDMKSLI